MITVSVIIPIYNTAEYLRECIDSIINQTLSNIEIILINDGSTDGSEKIAAQYADTYNHVKLINQKNAGQSAARNKGLKEAAGKYIYFIDSDDLLSKTALEKLWAVSEREQLDMLAFAAKTFFASENLQQKFKDFDNAYLRKGSYDEVVNGKNLLAALQENGDYRVSVCLQLIRREFLLENEIWFYEGIIHEDNLFTFEVLMKAERARCIHNIYYYRRMRSSSTMTKKKTSANLRGYYISVIEHIKIAAKEDFTVKQHAVVIKIIRNLLKNLEKIYNTIDMEEKDRFLKQCSCEEKYLFEGIFMTYLEELNRLTRVCQDTAKQKQDNHESIEQEFCWSRKIRTGKRVLKQEGMKGFLRLILYKVSTRLERFGFFWLIKNRGILYTWYRAKLKIAPSKICVSIIIPVYNAEKYLDACLQSIMNQSLKQIEVICVNDGSTDRSMEILNRYKSKDSRFKIIEQDKQGAGAARNKGIAYAKGEYLLFLDADDLFSPELCNTAYFQSKKDKAQVCLFGAQRYDMKDKRMEKMDWVLRENEIPNGVFSAADISKSIFQITTGCPWSKMFSRKYVLNNKLQYQNLKNSNDVFFVRTACAAAERITAVKGSVLVTYRYHGGQNIQSLKMKAPLEFYKAFQALKEELKRRGLYSLMEQSFVNMALQESLFNLETAGSKKAQKVVEELLVREGFAYLELEKYDQEYFYDTKKYEEYLKIINDCKN